MHFLSWRGLEALNKLKPVEVDETVSAVIRVFGKNFGGVSYQNAKEQAIPISLYCSALYLQMKRLSSRYDITSIQTRSGGISGISKRGFTKKDFMDKYTTGKKKLIWGNPYMLKEKRKGEGEVVSLLTKASGKLRIMLDIPDARASELEDMIESAGVSAFYLGKKGLAYVSSID